MERDHAREQLDQVERGEAAPWVHFAGREWWQPPVFGAWAGTFVLASGMLDGVLRSLVTLALAVVPLAYVVWDRRRRPVFPRGPMPREMRRSSWFLLGLAPAVALASAAAYFAAGAGTAAVVAAVATAGAVEVYGRVYAADADRVRRRVA